MNTGMQVVWESQLSTADESALQDAMLQRLAEREVGYYGKPGLPRPGAITKSAAPGMVQLCQHLKCPWHPSLPGDCPAVA